MQFLLVGTLSFPFNGVNTLIERRARGPVHVQLINDMVVKDMNNSIVLFNNFFSIVERNHQCICRQEADTPIVFVPDMLLQ